MAPHFGLRVDALLLLLQCCRLLGLMTLILSPSFSISVLCSLARLWLLFRHARPVGVAYMQTMNGQTGPVTRPLRVVWCGVVWCGVATPGPTLSTWLFLCLLPLYLCLCRFVPVPVPVLVSVSGPD